MSILAACLLLTTSGSGPAGCAQAPAIVRPFDAQGDLGALVEQASLREEVARTMALFAATPRQFALRGLPPLVRVAFLHPFALPECARFAAAPAERPAEELRQRPWRALAAYAARALGAPEPSAEGQGEMKCNDPQRAVFAMDFLLNEPARALREALAAAEIDPQRVAAAEALVRGARESTGRGTGRTVEFSNAVRATTQVDRATLAALAAHLDVRLQTKGEWAAQPAEDLPEELKGAVEGTILTAQQVPELGWIVVGSTGPNRYDMSRVAAVFDPGGDDVYEWPSTVVGSRAIVDLEGNDRYRALPAATLGGPGGGVLGVSIIEDFAGDDRYEANACALGAACFGLGVIVDHAGNDLYRGGTWCEGAAIVGVGAIVDLDGSDEYVAETFSQACGGPGGAALLLDAAGNDRYRADGSEPSAYGTPAVHMSFSQGAGFGYRAGAPGGLGALVDLAGNDRYECGEFGQGIGYFLSMGVLHDAGGNDFYYGNRYAQGTAAHQAFGALLDDAGDDLYWSMTAAGQGAAWDISVAALVDAGGDDRYQADGLSQGAAAQQAIGMLLDLGGSDDYRAVGASQGAADSNQYHWETTRARSFGLLFDAGGPNKWSLPRADGERRVIGDAGRADGATQWGFFLAVPGK